MRRGDHFSGIYTAVSATHLRRHGVHLKHGVKVATRVAPVGVIGQYVFLSLIRMGFG
jgi:hypothetical protein